MVTVTKAFELFEFDELPQKAQDKAMNDFINFEIETMDEDSPYYHCSEEMDRMQTPWFLAESIYEQHKNDLVETIKMNSYLFFKDGLLIPSLLIPSDYYPK